MLNKLHGYLNKGEPIRRVTPWCASIVCMLALLMKVINTWYSSTWLCFFAMINLKCRQLREKANEMLLKERGMIRHNWRRYWQNWDHVEFFLRELISFSFVWWVEIMIHISCRYRSIRWKVWVGAVGRTELKNSKKIQYNCFKYLLAYLVKFWIHLAQNID